MSWMSKLGKVLMPERITNYFKLKQDLNEMEKTSGNSLFNQILEFRNTQQIMKDFLREDDFKKKVESIGQSTQACIKSLREAPNPYDKKGTLFEVGDIKIKAKDRLNDRSMSEEDRRIWEKFSKYIEEDSVKLENIRLTMKDKWEEKRWGMVKFLEEPVVVADTEELTNEQAITDINEIKAAAKIAIPSKALQNKMESVLSHTQRILESEPSSKTLMQTKKSIRELKIIAASTLDVPSLVARFKEEDKLLTKELSEDVFTASFNFDLNVGENFDSKFLAKQMDLFEDKMKNISVAKENENNEKLNSLFALADLFEELADNQAIPQHLLKYSHLSNTLKTLNYSQFIKLEERLLALPDFQENSSDPLYLLKAIGETLEKYPL